MRKPLLVVCGVTAAMLLAGGVAATTAGADETPGRSSGSGMSWPSLNFAQFPWFTGADGDDEGDAGGDGTVGATGSGDTNQTSGDDRFPDRPGTPAAGTDQSGADRAGGVRSGRDRGQSGADADKSGANKSDADQADADQAGADQAGADQAGATGQHADTAGRTPQRAGGAADRRSATAAQAPAAPKPAAQKSGQAQSLTAAAQRDVSPGRVSTSAGAPFQQQVLTLINQNRHKGGCGSLTLDPRLIRAAFGHATDMARRDYFAHESPNGDGPGDRVSDAGFQWSRYGENIARGPGSAYEVVDGWMHSPEHRENIMDCRFREMGLGLAFDGDKEPYWVQDFGTPRT